VKVLVTGATGFPGGHLVEKLVSEGYEVRALARRTSNVHLAAYHTFFGKKELYELVNVKGTQWLAEAALDNGVTRFVYCSSEVIGPVKNPLGDENTPLNPQFEYGRSKVRAESVVRGLAARGLKYTIVRPTGIYGPRNVDDFAYWFITSYAKGGLASKVEIGMGENLVQFAHVEDVVQGFILVLEKEDVAAYQTYIVSEDRWYTYKQVYQILHELTGKGPPSVKPPPAAREGPLSPPRALRPRDRRGEPDAPGGASERGDERQGLQRREGQEGAGVEAQVRPEDRPKGDDRVVQAERLPGLSRGSASAAPLQHDHGSRVIPRVAQAHVHPVHPQLGQELGGHPFRGELRRLPEHLDVPEGHGGRPLDPQSLRERLFRAEAGYHARVGVRPREAVLPLTLGQHPANHELEHLPPHPPEPLHRLHVDAHADDHGRAEPRRRL